MTLETIEKVKAYIDEHIGEDLTNIRLSKKFAYTSQMLKIGFEQYEGMPLHKYVIKTRMKKAREYLENGYYAAELPYMLGYRNPDAFRKMYKKVMGEYPKKAEMRLRK